MSFFLSGFPIQDTQDIGDSLPYFNSSLFNLDMAVALLSAGGKEFATLTSSVVTTDGSASYFIPNYINSIADNYLVYLDGVKQLPTVNYTINAATSSIVFTSPVIESGIALEIIRAVAVVSYTEDPTKLPIAGGNLTGGLRGTNSTFTNYVSAPALRGDLYGNVILGSNFLSGNNTFIQNGAAQLASVFVRDLGEFRLKYGTLTLDGSQINNPHGSITTRSLSFANGLYTLDSTGALQARQGSFVQGLTAANLNVTGGARVTGSTQLDGTLTIGRQDNGQEGGEIRLCRSSDNVSEWVIDALGAGTGTRFRIHKDLGGEKMTILDNGNVGFGTSAPNSKLHVAGNVTFDTTSTVGGGVSIFNDDNIKGPSMQMSGLSGAYIDLSSTTAFGGSGSLGDYTLRLASWVDQTDNNKRVSFINANQTDLIFQTNDTAKLTIKNSGNVGIGETNPVRQLVVTSPTEPNILLRRSSGSPDQKYFRIYQPNTTPPVTYFSFVNDAFTADTFAYGIFGSSAGISRHTWFAGTSASSTSLMTLLSSGNLGIGNNNPGSHLSLGTIGTVPEIALAMQNSYVRMSQRNTQDEFGITTNFATNGGNDTAKPSWGLFMGAGTADCFNVKRGAAGSTSQSTLLWLTSGGNLGIGSTTPTDGLTILRDGNTQFNLERHSSDISPAFIVGTKRRGTNASKVSVADEDRILSIQSYGYDGTADRHAAAINFEVDHAPANNSVPGRILFFTTQIGTSQTPQEKMRITSAGFVGIGTATPTDKLHVTAVDGTFATGTRPSGWGGGITTWDMYAGGTIGAGSATGSLSAYMSRDGYIWAGNSIGIGSSAINYDLQISKSKPGQYLEVKAENTSSANSTTARYTLATGAANAYSIWEINNGAASPSVTFGSGDGATGGMYFTAGNTVTNQPIIFRQSAMERLRIDASGNIGIGTSTPNSNLTVSGNISATGFIYGNGSNLTGLTIGSYLSSGGGTLTGNLSFSSGAGRGIYINPAGQFGTSIFENQINASYGYNGTTELALNYVSYQNQPINFRNLNVYNGKSGSVAFFEGSTGNVGIGTINIAAKLHVLGAANTMLLESAAQETVIDFKNTSANGRQWRVGTGGSAGGFAGGIFGIYDATAGATRLSINSSGTVSIPGNIAASGTVTGLTFSGSGASLTNIPQSAVTNLTSDLAGKASTSHTHTTSQITGLDTTLAGKLNTTGGTLAGSLTVNGTVNVNSSDNSGSIFTRVHNFSSRTYSADKWYRFFTFDATNQGQTATLILRNPSGHDSVEIKLSKHTTGTNGPEIGVVAEIRRLGAYAYAYNITKIRVVDEGVNLPTHLEFQLGSSTTTSFFLGIQGFVNAVGFLLPDMTTVSPAAFITKEFFVCNGIQGDQNHTILGLSTLAKDLLYVNGSGNVGIGTSEPSTLLDVAGNTKITGSVQGGSIVTATRDSARGWRGIALSFDGVNQTAVVYGGQIYTSSNSGSTWVARDVNRNWNGGIAVSYYGNIQTATLYGGQLYVSTNYGATWVAKDVNRNWESVAMSADGTVQTAVVYGGQIYVSTDSGNTWNPKDLIRDWKSIAVSSDGTIQTAVVYGGQIYVSTDSGNTWNPKSVNRQYDSVAISSSGARQTVVVYGGQIFRSTDYGNNWSTALSTTKDWNAVTMSADGKNQLAIAGSFAPSYVYRSTDYGVSWIETDSSRAWGAIAMSGDGTKQTAVINNGLIYLLYNEFISHFASSVAGGTEVSKLHVNTIITENLLQPTTSSGMSLDVSSGSFFKISLTTSITSLVFANVPVSSKVYSFVIQLVADGTARTVAWPASVKWPSNAAPSITSTSGKIDTFSFLTYDGGTTWFGYIMAQNH